ncbi:MAG: hypothetical protein L6U16_04470 [Porphyromonadaceae bacterium]|nr:MAG: hypothetical protein L6U16_04470 [Porphyromonadaceae bacterium]
MKKIIILFAVAIMAFANAWAATATFDFAHHGAELFGFTAPSSSSSTEGDITSECTATVDGVMLKVGVSTTNTKNRVYLDYNGNVQLRVYSGAVTVAAPAGKTISSIVFHNSRWYAPASVSSGSFVQESTWGGNAASVTFNFDGQCRLDSMLVTYDDGVTIDPTVKELDTFLSFGDSIADGTKIRFTGMAFVVLNIGKFHFVRCESEYLYSAIIYGDLDTEYKVGEYIPAGWTGVKGKVDGITVITGVEGLKPASVSASNGDCEAFDFTGYLGTFKDGVSTYENDYCAFKAVAINSIDADGKFTITETNADSTTSTMAGINKFGIEYPATTANMKFTVQGILTKSENGVGVTFVPTAITEYENVKKLWRIWYQGVDGTEYTIADTLYVVAPTKALEPDCGRKNLIYVTDNATQVVDDTYAEWGYVETYDWAPDYIALDCGDNEEAYRAIAAMKVIAPATVRGILADNQTNPRFELMKTPSALDCEYPEIAYQHYQFGDSCWANGNQVSYASGKFVTIDGKEYFAGINADGTANQPIALDRRYIGDYAFSEGNTYEMRVVWKQHEPWTFDSSSSPITKKMSKKSTRPMPHKNEDRRPQLFQQLFGMSSRSEATIHRGRH